MPDDDQTAKIEPAQIPKAPTIELSYAESVGFNMTIVIGSALVSVIVFQECIISGTAQSFLPLLLLTMIAVAFIAQNVVVAAVLVVTKFVGGKKFSSDQLFFNEFWRGLWVALLVSIGTIMACAATYSYTPITVSFLAVMFFSTVAIVFLITTGMQVIKISDLTRTIKEYKKKYERC